MKDAEQQRQARLAGQDAELKASAKKKASVKAKPVTKAPAKKSVAKATSLKAASQSSISSSKSPSERTYWTPSLVFSHEKGSKLSKKGPVLEFQLSNQLLSSEVDCQLSGVNQ